MWHGQTHDGLNTVVCENGFSVGNFFNSCAGTKLSAILIHGTISIKIPSLFYVTEKCWSVWNAWAVDSMIIVKHSVSLLPCP
jgi:hypothetical protein